MAAGIPTFKVVLVGEYGVGKTSLFERFVYNTFREESPNYDRPLSPLPVDNYSRVFCVNNRKLTIDLWDTAGLERFSSLSNGYFMKATAIIVCFGYDSKESFNAIAHHICEAVEQTSAAVFLCCNKVDKKPETDMADFVKDNDISDLLLQFGDIITDTFSISCKTGQGFDEMFFQISRTLICKSERRENITRILLNKDKGNQIECC